MKNVDKKLLIYILLIILMVLVISVKQISDIRFKDKPFPPGTENSEINNIVVSGNIFVALSSYDKMKYNFNELSELDLENVSTYKSGDTLKINYAGKNRNMKNSAGFIYNAISINVQRIGSIIAKNGAQIQSSCLSPDSINIAASDSSYISFYSYCQLKGATVHLSGNARAYLSYYNIYKMIEAGDKISEEVNPTIDVNMKGNSNFILSLMKAKVIGSLNNRSAIELNENIEKSYDISALGIKDSSAVIFKTSQFSNKAIINYKR